MLRKIEGRRRGRWQRRRWLDGITDSMDVWVDSGSWWRTVRPSVLRFMGSQRVGHDWATELNWKAESGEKLKSLLMKVKEENEKAGLKFSIPKTKIMAPSSITSWKIDGGKMETMTDFIFLGSKITADGDCSYKIKRCLLLGRKTITNLYSILKSRDITLLTKVHIVKAMAFPVVMHGCESWTIKKAEHRRIDAFELWC